MVHYIYIPNSETMSAVTPAAAENVERPSSMERRKHPAWIVFSPIHRYVYGGHGVRVDITVAEQILAATRVGPAPCVKDANERKPSDQ